MNGPETYAYVAQLLDKITAARVQAQLNARKAPTGEEADRAAHLDLLTALTYAVQANTAAHVVGPQGVRAMTGGATRNRWLEVIS